MEESGTFTRPILTVEGKIIKKLVDLGVIVIASGGGGIPVIKEENNLKGVEAVIDKDLAGERLAEATGANIFLILTDIEKAKLNFGKPNETNIDMIHIGEAKKYLEKATFGRQYGTKDQGLHQIHRIRWRKSYYYFIDKA